MHDIILKNAMGSLIAISLISALALLLFPKSLKRTNDFLNTWISTRKLLRPLERMIIVDDQIYKNCRVLGALFLLFTPISKNISGLLIPVSISIAMFLLFFPNTLKRTNDFLNNWVSTRKLLRPLEIPRNVDDKIYKRRRILATLFLIIIPFLTCCYIML